MEVKYDRHQCAQESIRPVGTFVGVKKEEILVDPDPHCIFCRGHGERFDVKKSVFKICPCVKARNG